MSNASNLAPGVTSGDSHVYVHNRQTGQTLCVSVAPDGSQGNAWSDTPAISGNGQFVAFDSVASNLVPGVTSGVRQVYVRDCTAGKTTLVSVGSGGGEGNGVSLNSTITADGRYVAFNSAATDLVPGVTNGKSQVYVYDTHATNMVCASLGHDGSQGDSDSYIAYISADGSCVAFISRAGNLVTGIPGGQDLIYVRDLRAGTNSCVSLAPNGNPANAPCNASSISADGRFVGFDSRAANLVAGVANGYDNCFVRDRQSGTTALVSVASGGALGNADSDSPQLSADGRLVVFESDASNLVSGDTNQQTDVFLRDLQAGQTTRVSVSASGGQLNDFSWVGLSSISSSGTVIAFHTDARNVVPGMTDFPGDVYVRDLGSVTNAGALAIAGNASRLTVSWPAALVATLQTNSSLASTNWTAYGGTVISLGGTNTVTLAPTTSKLFFRLH